MGAYPPPGQIGTRLGHDLYSSVGISGLQPATVAPQLLNGGESGWNLFVEWQQRFVARDIFLDGNTHKESHSVEKEPRVGEWRFGAVFPAGRYR